MSVTDLLFMALVIGLPIATSLRLFLNEPPGRSFVATYALAVVGSGLLFGLCALALSVARIGGLGMFDGFFAFLFSIPAALIVGLLVRRRSPTR